MELCSFLLLCGLVLICALISFGILVCVFYVRYLKFLGILEKAKHDKPNPQEGPDVIVVGAGVVGSVIATVLARDGRKVTVIERSMKPPDRLPGDSMHAGGLQAMKELGVEVSAIDVNGTFADRMEVFTPEGEIIKFPFESRSINAVNGNLVDCLRKKALNEKRCTVIEGNVSNLLLNEGLVTGVVYKRNDGENSEVLRAPLTILADGSNSRLRGVNIPRKPVWCSHNIGLLVDSEADISGYSVIPVSIGCIALFYIAPGKLRIFVHTYKKWDKSELLDIQGEIPECFREVYIRAVETVPHRNVPVLYLPPSMKHVPGVITIGDALSVRNSLTGAGMSNGLMDVRLWRRLLKGVPDLFNHEAMFAAENVFAIERKKYCFMIDLFGRCIRHFFVPQTDGLKQLGKTFGEYGATIKKDYANMLAVMDTRPQMLLYHLTKVTMISLYQAFTSRTCCGLPCGFYQAGQVLYAAYVTIVPHTLSQIRSMVVTK